MKVQGLNDGLTVLDLRVGNTITLAQLRKVLKDNGFVSKEAHISARSTVAERGSQLMFTIARHRRSVCGSISDNGLR